MADSRPKCNACRETCKGGATPAPRGGFICRDETACFRAYARQGSRLSPVNERTQNDG